MARRRGRPRKRSVSKNGKATPRPAVGKRQSIDSSSSEDEDAPGSNSSIGQNSYSDNHRLESEEVLPLYDDDAHNPHLAPATGHNCKRHKALLAEMDRANYANLRTLYSHFPRENLRLFALHLIVTGLIYVAIFPFVNFFWTYFINVDDQILNLFSVISDEPSYSPGSLGGHLNRLRWFTFPAINAECIALLLAIITKDAITLNWEDILESRSLPYLIAGNIAKRHFAKL